MGTTDNYDLPYPELSDAANVPTRIQQLAEATDTALTSIASPVWTSFTPAWTNVTLGTTGLVNTASYIQIGEMVTVKFHLTLGTGGSFGGTINLALPVTAIDESLNAVGVCLMDDTSVGSSARRAGTISQLATTSTQFYVSGDSAGSKVVAASVPFTWAVGDTIAGTFSYEAA